MRNRPPSPLLLLLVLAGCTPLSTEPPAPTGVAGVDSAPGDTADTALSEGWSDTIGRRLDAEDAAFRPIDGGAYLAVHPLMGLDAQLADGEMRLFAGQDRVTLRTVGLSRSGAGDDSQRVDVGQRDAALHGCVTTGDVDARGDCIPRAELASDGLVEWWESTPGMLQAGWDLDTPPAGSGPLAIRVAVGGAELQLDADDDRAVTFGAPTHDFGFGGLIAWDDDGQPLDAWMEVDGDDLVVRVDDAGARWPIHVDPVTFTAGWSTSGSSSANYGRSVAGVGDVNFDGYADVAVGASAYSSSTGRVYVYHGATTGLSTSANLTLTGSTTSNYFGRSVEGAGDINADGFDDIVIGADGVGSGAGAAYIYYGSSTGLATTPGTTLTGSSGSSFGYAVAAAGDVNGDNYDDVIIGAYTQGSPDNIGAAYVYHGANTGLATTAATTLAGAGTFAGFGIDVSRAGDVDADGYDDVIVGASTYSSNTGYASIFHGSAAGVSTTATRTLSGTAAIENFGAAVSAAGDVDADGYDDVIIGAWGYASYYGIARVYHGSASGIAATATTSITGPATAYYGFAVADAGDMNDDGYDDVVVGGYIYSSSAGLVRSYLGSSSGVSSSYNGTVTGSTTYCLGYSVAGAGDINGDGYDDIVAGGYCASSGNGYGAAYYGSADEDGDGYYAGSGVSSASRDCDDTDALVNPGVTETVNDGIDNTCDGYERCYDDDDNDGYLDTTADTRQSSDLDCADNYEGLATDPTTDCDDSDASDYPSATETVGNGDDEDCDGTEICYEDDDDDGYLDTTGDTVASADTDCADTYEGRNNDPTTDCDDADSAFRPNAVETIGDEIDQNCDNGERCYDDDDDDGYLDSSGDVRVSSDTDCTDAFEATSTAPTTDCDDGSALDNPAAVEIVGNADDDDCDGSELCYDDDDNDGWLDASGDTRITTDLDCADAYEGTTTDLTTDCDDTVATARPGGTEVVASGIDEDCDGVETCYVDGDDDGYLVVGPTTFLSADGDCADAGEGTTADPTTDCDDADAGANPAAAETPADEVDQDCDTTELCYGDADGDGYSDGTTVVSTDEDCADTGEITAAAYALAVDCDDTLAASNPGAAEVCDAADIDEDCDGAADDADPDLADSAKSTWHADDDGDGAGDDADTVTACDAPAGYVATGGDCDETDPAIYGGAPEQVGSGVDEDCDGGELCYSDADADGWATSTQVTSADADCADSGEATASTYASGADCDDAVATVSPGAAEVCDAADVDEDCDGVSDDADASVDSSSLATWYLDEDDDAYGADDVTIEACEAPSGYAAAGGDCDDGDDEIAPGATEIVGDAVDQDCDGVEDCYADTDLDGWAGEAIVTSADLDCGDEGEADGVTAAAGVDCLDEDATVNPDAQEVCDERDVDEDCDGLSDDRDDSATGQFDGYLDADTDGYGDAAAGITACDPTELYVLLDGDCDDTDPDVNPSADELCNEIDDDCDGDPDGNAIDAPTWYPDGDGDGYGSDLGVADCGAPEAFVSETGDCDDAAPLVHPGAEETCNQIDDDCDGEPEPDELCELVLDEGKGGCGCASGGSGGAVTFAMAGALLALAARRRRSGV